MCPLQMGSAGINHCLHLLHHSHQQPHFLFQTCTAKHTVPTISQEAISNVTVLSSVWLLLTCFVLALNAAYEHHTFCITIAAEGMRPKFETILHGASARTEQTPAYALQEDQV